MIDRVTGYPPAVWMGVLPLWLAVSVESLLPMSARALPFAVGVVAVATLCLPVSMLRWVCLSVPVLGVVAHSVRPSVAATLVAVVGLLCAIVVLGLLDGWDVDGPRRPQMRWALPSDGVRWARIQTGVLLAVTGVTMGIALLWAGLDSVGWAVPGWWVSLTPALTVVAIAAATSRLWRR